jgi:hypothetical protein
LHAQFACPALPQAGSRDDRQQQTDLQVPDRTDTRRPVLLRDRMTVPKKRPEKPPVGPSALRPNGSKGKP